MPDTLIRDIEFKWIGDYVISIIAAEQTADIEKFLKLILAIESGRALRFKGLRDLISPGKLSYWKRGRFRVTAKPRMARTSVTGASGRDTNAISPDTEIRRRHIGATSADDPCAAAHSSNCRERIETPVPSGDIENAITLRRCITETDSRNADFSTYRAARCTQARLC